MRLPRDERDREGFYTRPDNHTPRHHEILKGLINEWLLIHYQLTSSDLVTVGWLSDAT